MFGWIESIFHWGVSNIGGTIVGWVRDFIRGLYGYLHLAFHLVGNAWGDLWGDVNRFWHALDAFGHSVWQAIYHTLHTVIPDVRNFLHRLIARVERYAQYVFRWAVVRAEWLLHKIESEISFVIRWVITHIWDPLFRDVTTALKWIFSDGQTLWYYLTHPDKTVDLIWESLIAKLEQEAWAVGRRLGEFFLGLVLHNARRFALLLEDIIVALI